MTRTTLTALVATLTLAATGATSEAAPKPRDIVGKYICRDTNENGLINDGTAEITRTPSGTLEIRYDFGPRHDVGTIELTGNRVTAQFAGLRNKKRTGEAQYQLLKNGELVGRWHYHGWNWEAERLIPIR
jgi:hypothetical protein